MPSADCGPGRWAQGQGAEDREHDPPDGARLREGNGDA